MEGPRLQELDKERAALVGPKGQKRKRAEGGDKARKPKGGKSPIPGGKGKAGKAGKGAAKKCFVCESTEHMAADCDVAEQVRRMRRAGTWRHSARTKIGGSRMLRHLRCLSIQRGCWDISSTDSPLSPSVNLNVQRHRLTRLRVMVLGCMAF